MMNSEVDKWDVDFTVSLFIVRAFEVGNSDADFNLGEFDSGFAKFNIQ